MFFNRNQQLWLFRDVSWLVNLYPLRRWIISYQHEVLISLSPTEIYWIDDSRVSYGLGFDLDFMGLSPARAFLANVSQTYLTKNKAPARKNPQLPTPVKPTAGVHPYILSNRTGFISSKHPQKTAQNWCRFSIAKGSHTSSSSQQDSTEPTQLIIELPQKGWRQRQPQPGFQKTPRAHTGFPAPATVTGTAPHPSLVGRKQRDPCQS